MTGQGPAAGGCGAGGRGAPGSRGGALRTLGCPTCSGRPSLASALLPLPPTRPSRLPGTLSPPASAFGHREGVWPCRPGPATATEA